MNGQERFLFLRWPKINLASSRGLMVFDILSRDQFVCMIVWGIGCIMNADQVECLVCRSFWFFCSEGAFWTTRESWPCKSAQIKN